jgi:hypothetical protein
MMQPTDLAKTDFRFKGLPGLPVLAVGVAALVGAAAILMLGGVSPQHAKFSYLTSFMYCLSLALGALFFVTLHHLANARWSVVVRRLAEAVMMNLGWLLIAVLPILFWLPDLYPWMRPEAALDPVIKAKQAYLNPQFFMIRIGVYFAVWLLLSNFFSRLSLRQDTSGDVGLSLTMRKVSAPGMLLFALTLTFAAFDLIMSLDPKWYSTIFGVYYYGGAYLGFMALLILIANHVQSKHYVPVISAEHFHDMGKYLFAWVVFWTYIAFSQLLLIWMANVPEETIFFTHRWQAPGWRAISYLLIFGHFIIPFLYLLPRTIKRNKLGLSIGALWLLVMHYFDLYWNIMPNFNHEHLPLHPFDILLWIGMLGVFTFLVYVRLRQHPLVPVRDPYLADSIGFENF